MAAGASIPISLSRIRYHEFEFCVGHGSVLRLSFNHVHQPTEGHAELLL
jgi:hypothetical protein